MTWDEVDLYKGVWTWTRAALDGSGPALGPRLTRRVR